MKANLEKKIFEDFPDLFKDRKSTPLMPIALGIDTGDGWYQIIYDLSKDISKYNQNLPSISGLPDLRVDQIKEKYGTLRYYVNHADNYVWERIGKAETLSSKTCELCGKKGSLTYRAGYFQTLCKECRKKKGASKIGKPKRIRI